MNDQHKAVSKFIEPLPDFSVKVAKISALMGGTTEMRKSGGIYLPQFEGETDKSYHFRKETSVLFNGFKKTVNDITGRIFERPVALSEDAPERFQEWAGDIDMERRDLSIFAHDLLRSGIAHGIQYLMVDAPPKSEGQTVADDVAQNIRPYLISIDPMDVLGFRVEKIANKPVLVQIRIMESVVEPDGEFGQAEIEQIRVLDRLPYGVEIRLFRKTGAKKQWQQFGPTTMSGLPEITITAFYTNRKSFLKGEPFLDDLADLNIAHWQSQSDQRSILHFARVPILFASGISMDTDLKISAASLTRSEDPQGDMKFVEHSGAAIAAGAADLKHLEFMMEVLGLQTLVETIGIQTATGEMRQDKKENTRLAMIADNLQAALERCFHWMGDYAGIEFTGSVMVHKEFAPMDMSPQIFQTLLTAVTSGNISRKTFWEELARRGVFGDDFVIDDEQDRIDNEGEDLAFVGLDG